MADESGDDVYVIADAKPAAGSAWEGVAVSERIISAELSGLL